MTSIHPTRDTRAGGALGSRMADLTDMRRCAERSAKSKNRAYRSVRPTFCFLEIGSERPDQHSFMFFMVSNADYEACLIDGEGPLSRIVVCGVRQRLKF